MEKCLQGFGGAGGPFISLYQREIKQLRELTAFLQKNPENNALKGVQNLLRQHFTPPPGQEGSRFLGRAGRGGGGGRGRAGFTDTHPPPPQPGHREPSPGGRYPTARCGPGWRRAVPPPSCTSPFSAGVCWEGGDGGTEAAGQVLGRGGGGWAVCSRPFFAGGVVEPARWAWCREGRNLTCNAYGQFCRTKSRFAVTALSA